MSLFDLIYSQSEETSNREKSPPKRQTKRPKLEPQHVAAGLEEQHDEAAPQREDDDEEALDYFYEIPNASLPEPTMSSNGVQRQRKRKRGRPPMEPREPEWETVSQAEDRVRRLDQRKERQLIQKRWKKRLHNVQDEVDYGNSVQHMARLIMRRKNKSADDERKPAAVPDYQQRHVESSSDDDEQQEALGSLWKSMTPQEETNDDEDYEKSVDEYAEWDYWQLGYNAPRKKDLEQFYYYHHSRDKSPFRLNHAGRQKRLKEMEDVTLVPYTRGRPDQMYYLKRDLPTKCYNHSLFHHRTCLRTMAARCLMKSGGSNLGMENRLLRALYSAPSRTVGREYHVLTQAMERGSDFVLYQSHKWKNSSAAARALGMTARDEHTGPRVGFSLERKMAVWREASAHRANVVRLLSEGKTPYRHDGSYTDATTPIDDPMDVIYEADPEEVDLQPENDDDNVEINVDAPNAAKLSGPDGAFFREFLSSHVDYVHIPGTMPPLPSFPLDESGILIGGEDRYSRVYHSAKIDEATYAVTLSLLLARLGRARLEKDGVEEAQEQVMTFVTEVAQENVWHLPQMNYMRRKRKEQPSALYYKAMMGYCSVVANSGCSFASAEHNQDVVMPERDWRDDDSDDDEDAVPTGTKTSVTNMQAVAQVIHEQCAGCPTSSSLTIFPRIHITTALTLIAKDLPPSAAEILSQPLEEVSCRTPFDIMRMMLEHLEENNLLVDSHILHTDGTSVNAGHLEHIVHQATDIFRGALEIDPTDLNCHAWYVSGLAASLLLCSGNAIDSKAHILPSSKKREEEYDIIFSSADAIPTSTHAVRQKMPKFADLRRDAANAIQKMIRLAHVQKNLRGHLIASSVLEWKQLVALLVGSTLLARGESSISASIRRLHSHHALQWAVRERSHYALCMVNEMHRRHDVAIDAVLTMLAADLENKPGDIYAWRRLVRALGAVGVEVPGRQRKECKKRQCGECKRLRQGLNVDHVMLAERKENLGWWGTGRTTWWDSQVIAMPQDVKSADGATSGEVFRVSSAIEKQIVRKSRSLHHSEFDRAERRAQMRGVGVAFEKHVDLSWLDCHASSEEIEVDDRHEDYGRLLPTRFQQMIKAGDGPDAMPASLALDLNAQDPALEIICYKIILACHLYSVSHAVVHDGIWFLAQGCIENNTVADISKWRCLLWLSSLGLNIPQILHHIYVDVKKTSIRPSRYSADEKEAIRIGLELFGKRWSSIRDHFPVFADASRSHVQHVYRSMKVLRELE